MEINGYKIKPGADLSGADLSGADLRRANLSGADLRRADLRDADLRDADLFSATNWMSENFQTTNEGFIVYKDIKSKFYNKPEKWTIQENNYIDEVCNSNQTNQCGCGVNFATKQWLENNSNHEIWECLIEWKDLVEVCVPYNTDGKARCARLKLIKKLI